MTKNCLMAVEYGTTLASLIAISSAIFKNSKILPLQENKNNRERSLFTVSEKLFKLNQLNLLELIIKKRSKNKPNKTKDRFKYLIRLELSNGDAFS